MTTSRDAFNTLIQQLEARCSTTFQVAAMSSNIYSIDFSYHNLVIYYYLPESTRIHLDRASSKKAIIHLDEDRWLNRGDLVINRILNRLGQVERLYGRTGVVARIDKKTTLSFLEEHHLHTPIPGKYRYGLFIDGELMSIGVFSGGRLMRHTEGYRSFECIRFCTKQGYVVVGGLSKLLKAFSQDFRPSDVMTYVDRDWSDGRGYEKLGFERVGYTEPQYYLIDRKNHQRTAYQPESAETKEILKKGSHYLLANSGSTKMIKRY